MTELSFRKTRESLPEELRDYSKWPQVDPECLSGKAKRVFLKRYDAITRYMDGEKVGDITKSVPISLTELLRLRDKCLEIDERTGDINGFSALLFYGRSKKYTRRVREQDVTHGPYGGRAGALGQLFEAHPSIERYLRAMALKKGRVFGAEVLETRIPSKTIHKKFIELCRNKGISGSQYPFNTETHGRRSIATFVRSVLLCHFKDGARVYGKDAAIKAGSDTEANRQYPEKPLVEVEFDAHKLDAHWILKLADRYGGYIDLILERIWLLVVIDVYSRAVLGYYLSYRTEYNQYDVLRCFKRAIEPWKPPDLSAIPGLKYPPGAGMPSSVLPRYRWALWDKIVYDNAMANLAIWVRKLLTRTLGCAVNAGPVYTKDHQPFVERFFGTLEQSIHRLPNTTGSNPADPLRIDPENAALKYEMTVDEMSAFVAYYLATYNIEPHGGVDNLTPMEVLERFSRQEENLIRTLPEKKQKQLWWFNMRKTVTVRGNLKEGRRPFVNFFHATYSSDVLRTSGWLIGQKITLTFDPTDPDCRQVMAFLDNGKSIGMLSVRGNWSRSAHSLELRQEIHKLKKRKILFCEEHDDPVQVYLEYKYKEALKKKRGRGKLAKAVEQGVGNHPQSKPQETVLRSSSGQGIRNGGRYAGKKARIL